MFDSGRSKMGLTSESAETTNAIRGIIASVADVPLSEVPASGPFFESVGLDSMMVVAIAVEIQEHFGIALPRTRLEVIALNSIERITQYVAQAMEQGTANGRL